MWFVVAKILFAPFITYLWATIISEGHILDYVGKWLNEEKNEALIWWRKPLGACLICCNIWVSLLCYFAPVEVVAFIGFVGISNFLFQKF